EDGIRDFHVTGVQTCALPILRRVAYAALVLVVVAAAALFTYNNPGRIDVDLGFVLLEGVPTSVAFAVTFAVGWFFGVLSAALALLRMSAERRRLRRELRVTEAEAADLRSLPVSHAD